MRAFVRMFMDLVGVFNDEHDFPNEGKLSGGNNNIIFFLFYLFLIYIVYLFIYRLCRGILWDDVW